MLAVAGGLLVTPDRTRVNPIPATQRLLVNIPWHGGRSATAVPERDRPTGQVPPGTEDWKLHGNH
jgi:hypothetical protein